MKLQNKKTGEIWDIGKILTNDYPSYDRLKDIIDDFEDIPKEPLIKDEKIRKAVIAWAYIASVGKDKVLYHIVGTKKEFEYYGNCLRFGTFDTYIANIEDKTYYTIVELCGEEDEN